MQPSIFMSVSFFVCFCKTLTKWENIIINKRWVFFLEELIFEKGTVYLNIPADEIKRLLELKHNKEAYLLCDEDTKLLVNYLSRLSNNKIRDCREAIQIFRNSEFAKYSNLSVKPDFVFLSETKSYCQEISEKFGIFCISNDIHLDVKNTMVTLTVLDKDEVLNLNDFNFLPKSNSLLIEDPYIIDNDEKGEFIDSLLSIFYPSNLQIKNFYLTIVYSSQKGIKTDVIRNRLERKYKLLCIDFIEKKDLHDRNIYSNSFWISCGFGFNKSYKKPTKWEIFPLAIYFSEYKKRLKAITKSSDFQKLNNPLVRLNQTV